MKEKIKNIVVISLGFLGDTILVEPMCRNIKENFPDTNLIFITNEIFKDIPYGFESVDKIYSFDKKKKHKGFCGYFKFLKDFKEEKIDYAIITHPHERSIILAKILRAKNIISLPAKNSPLNIFINKKRKFDNNELRTTYKADYNNGYLNKLCTYKNYNVNYTYCFSNNTNVISKYDLPAEYIVLSPTSKDLIKDWDYENIKEFILNCKKSVVLVGTDKANDIAQKLIKENIKFYDLSLKTSIKDLSLIIKNAKLCVSVDTGTLHLSYAQKVKTIGLFFNEKMVVEWTPNNLDFVRVIVGQKEYKDKELICLKNINYKDVIKEMEK